MNVLLLGVIASFLHSPGIARNHDPGAARLVKGDIPRFWRVFDGAPVKDAKERFQAEDVDAGTTSDNGLLIGVEMNAGDDQTPMDELGDWERAVIERVSNLPYIVAHELIHLQQHRDTLGRTLLKEALREGMADFVGEKISGGIVNPLQHRYGDAHEAALWEEIQEEMEGTDFGHWLFRGDKSRDRPADLGYYIGYEICKAYYMNASGKTAAIRTMLGTTDADSLLKANGYSPEKK